MVERRLSSPQEIRERYQKVGVVIFVLNQEGEVLVVRERSPNLITGKESGDFGVVCETSKEGEGWEETVIRGLTEELGINPQEMEDVFRIDTERCFLGESLFVEGVLARVVVVHWKGEKEMPLSMADNNEVSVAGWEKPENLLSYSLRIGVRKILQECLNEGLLEKNFLVSEENLLPLSVNNLTRIERFFEA
ncbi:hypothetical protein COU95_03690 [Candidatus Shapirobacteria bacterium CG10_big_fil_rev_8_21_14_0_10_40_9]|uniref:Nudix hydrolase domain-containing protein n=1 Tax=Candidatus Shapirobacteria bacterium CG10_big_fil_rev_8_21_14_0_10_40_9 TaxID=1974888 RepID=A0A2M8L2V3_9BACT|nr:MAG: hypothetical protein COU95_03690 [Candidatus Shapirobacteria bacterium CG10_big_fil_rev_8_21_14_0_10_40_9]